MEEVTEGRRKHLTQNQASLAFGGLRWRRYPQPFLSAFPAAVAAESRTIWEEETGCSLKPDSGPRIQME